MTHWDIFYNRHTVHDEITCTPITFFGDCHTKYSIHMFQMTCYVRILGQWLKRF